MLSLLRQKWRGAAESTIQTVVSCPVCRAGLVVAVSAEGSSSESSVTNMASSSSDSDSTLLEALAEFGLACPVVGLPDLCCAVLALPDGVLELFCCCCLQSALLCEALLW